MRAYVGQTIHNDGEFICGSCRHRVSLSKGDHVPRCPYCGNDTYEERRSLGASPVSYLLDPDWTSEARMNPVRLG